MDCGDCHHTTQAPRLREENERLKAKFSESDAAAKGLAEDYECERELSARAIKTAQDLKAKLEEATELIVGLVTQFGYWSDGKSPGFTTGGLSDLEAAFEFLGWDEPHFIEECCCDEKGCRKQATCGTPSPGGYRSVCGDHYREIEDRKKSLTKD